MLQRTNLKEKDSKRRKNSVLFRFLSLSLSAQLCTKKKRNPKKNCECTWGKLSKYYHCYFSSKCYCKVCIHSTCKSLFWQVVRLSICALAQSTKVTNKCCSICFSDEKDHLGITLDPWGPACHTRGICRVKLKISQMKTVVRYVLVMKKVSTTPLRVDPAIFMGEHGATFTRKRVLSSNK